VGLTKPNVTQAEKGRRLRELQERAGAFIIPNPYDAGTARLLEMLGFEALATTSSGYAFTLGKPDYGITREESLAGVRLIANAVEVPVSADLENGFGDAPETAAETIRLAVAAGAVGGSIEDSTREAAEPIYELSLATDRVRAAVEAARSLPFPFTLTARAENYLHGRTNLGDTIKRLQAYEQAGADVLFAPGLTSKEDIAAVVSSVGKPVNVLMGLRGVKLSLTELSVLGVKRISVGGGLGRAALAGFLRAAREMRESGTFGFAEEAVGSFSELTRNFK